MRWTNRHIPTSQGPVWQLGIIAHIVATVSRVRDQLFAQPCASHPCIAAARTPDSARAPWSVRGRSGCGLRGRSTLRRRWPPRLPSRCSDRLRGSSLRRCNRSAGRCIPRREGHPVGTAACNPAARWSCSRPPCRPTAPIGNHHRLPAIALPRRWVADPVSRAARLPHRPAQGSETELPQVFLYVGLSGCVRVVVVHRPNQFGDEPGAPLRIGGPQQSGLHTRVDLTE